MHGSLFHALTLICKLCRPAIHQWKVYCSC